MNILSSQQMKQKQRKLLINYKDSEIKFKLDYQELINAKQKKRSLFCFKQADSQTRLWIQKLVPLHKRVQILNLDEEQNGLFKALTFVFLFIIYKPKQEWNSYVKQHLKCSLYSDDIDLLEIRNHSFNKKMKSDTIKAIIASFFNQIEDLLETQIRVSNQVKVEDLLAFALQKNDIIVEGFHLFYRSILAKFEVENASNCIEEVNPQQAIQNLIDYFEIDCRIFNDLYLFPDSGVFMLRDQQNSLIFGRYYQNELYYQQTSDEEVDNLIKPNPQQQSQNSNQSKLIGKGHQIQKNDVKIFNFLLDTDRDTQQNFIEEKNYQTSTPCFIQNQDMKFGKKTDRDLDTSFSKLKNRLQNQKINQISSEEQEIESKKQNAFKINSFSQQYGFQQNKFLKLDSDDEQYEYDNAAPTPMLGGGQFLNFGKKQPNQNMKNDKNINKIEQLSMFPKQINQQTPPKVQKKNDILIQTKQIKESAIRRQTYQGEGNSSQSKSSDNTKKLEMKTSKNQIKVMDGTASQVNLTTNYQNKKISNQQFGIQRNQTIMECQKTSSYSNCTCHLQKKAKIKLSSQILSVVVSVSSQNKSINQNPSRKISTEFFQFESKKQIPSLNLQTQKKKTLFKNNINKSTQNLKKQNKKVPSPIKQPKDHQKSQQQFLNFLRKDKSQLIKKITQKRIAKHNVTVTSGEITVQRNYDNQNKNSQASRKYGKQSMFVGSYHFQNPQKNGNGKNDKNRSITPTGSIGKQQRNRNQRSRTPTQLNEKTQGSSQGMRLFKVKQKFITQNSNNLTFKSTGSIYQNYQSTPLNPCIPKAPLSIRIPINQNSPVTNKNQNSPVANMNAKPYQFYFKR